MQFSALPLVCHGSIISFIPGLKQKIPFIQKIIFIKIKIFKLSSRNETSHIMVKILSWDEKSAYNLPLNLSPITMKSAL